MSDFAIGRFKISVVYRQVSTDQGVTLHLFGPTESGEEEVLRFDCFRDQPHYHLGWSYRREPYTPIHAANPFDWVITQLKTKPNELLAAAGALVLDEQERSKLNRQLEQIRESGVALQRDAQARIAQ